MRCPFCGSSLESNAKYCNDCGTAVDSECSGKNINYRSYIDTRPQAASTPKTPSYRVRENNAASRPAQKTVKPAEAEKKIPHAGKVQNIPASSTVTPGQFGQFRGKTAKPAKKSGCAIVFVVIMVAFAMWSVIGSFLEDVDFESVFSTEPSSEYEYNYDYDFGDDDDGFAKGEMKGRLDGKYYLNDFVNFGLVIPEGFKESAAFTVDYSVYIVPDFCFENDDGEHILVGYSQDDDAFSFLTYYINEVYDSLADSGYTLVITDPEEKQVYNNGFISQSVVRDDGRVVSIYVCNLEDWVFFVEIDSFSEQINSQVADSFINSYSN